MSTKTPRVAIVGAGISGLSLACRLHHLKIPFRIYEARELDTIGHTYAIKLRRRSWRSLVQCCGPSAGVGVSSLKPAFRRENAADRLVGGSGQISHQDSNSKSQTFQAIDKNVRHWLVKRLGEKGVDINWNHKLKSIENADDGRGAVLLFEGKQPVSTDVIAITAGLRALTFLQGRKSTPEPTLLPYATYHGTRRIESMEFLEKYAHHFGDGNTLEFWSENTGKPYISIQKVHLPSKSQECKNHTVELRWIFSRVPQDEADALYQPNRTPDQAKDIPPEFFEQFLWSIREDFSGSLRSILSQFFTISDLHNDRILNWHLRIRLPKRDFFQSSSIKGGYHVIAIGDAAHELPIVLSQGAEVAMQDASDLAYYLDEIVKTPGVQQDKATDYYSQSSSYNLWYIRTVEALQRLRKAHGQQDLTASEIKDLLGFVVEDVDTFLDHEADESPSSDDSDLGKVRL